MEDINTVVKEPDSNVLELIDLMGMIEQTNQEKYEILNPIFQRLNLYCDEVSLRLERDSALFSIPLNVIHSVEYEEDGDTLFILFKKNKCFHSINISQRMHIIFTIKKRYNIIQRLYNRIRTTLIVYRLKLKFIKYQANRVDRNRGTVP